ncbi:hypothetical protein [Myroides odoratus]|uniref:hypothetical protein n=1 Tax=Myroides odoratus TaxID=256 RepID=UPI0039B0B534
MKVGTTVFYQWSPTEKSTFKSEFGIYGLNFKSSASGIKIRSMSGTRYLTGVEYQYNAAKGFRGVLGVHYPWNS